MYRHEEKCNIQLSESLSLELPPELAVDLFVVLLAQILQNFSAGTGLGTYVQILMWF